MHLGFILQPKKIESLFKSRFCSVACQTVHPDKKISIFTTIFGYGEFLSQKKLKN